MKELTSLLHILLCNKPHAKSPEELLNRQDTVCYYYLEEDVACEQLDHLRWENNAENFKDSMGFETDKEALNFLQDLLNISSQLQTLTDGKPNRRQFILTLLSN